MTHTKPCPECEGKGTVLYERAHLHNCSRDVGFLEEYEDDCENCGGSGEIDYEEEDYEDYENERGDWLYQQQKDGELDK